MTESVRILIRDKSLAPAWRAVSQRAAPRATDPIASHVVGPVDEVVYEAVSDEVRNEVAYYGRMSGSN